MTFHFKEIDERGQHLDTLPLKRKEPIIGHSVQHQGEEIDIIFPEPGIPLLTTEPRELYKIL